MLKVQESTQRMVPRDEYANACATSLACLRTLHGVRRERRSSGAGEQANGDTQRTEAFPVEVMTRFVVEGTNDLDERLHVDRLFMNVGAVLLDPVDGAAASFSSREPSASSLISPTATRSTSAGPALPYGRAYAVTAIELRGRRHCSKEAQPGSSVEVGGVYFVETPSPLSMKTNPRLCPGRRRRPTNPASRGSPFARSRHGPLYTATDVVRFGSTRSSSTTKAARPDLRDSTRRVAEGTSCLEQQDAERHPLQQLDVDAAQGDDDFERQVDGERVGFDALIGRMEASRARE